jgi:hypothetical protein
MEAARLLDLDRLERYRRELLESQRQRPRVRRQVNVEDMLKANPEMPRVVAEYYVAEAQRHETSSPSIELSNSFANVHDTTTLKQMGALELGVRWLEARGWRYQFSRVLRQSPSCKGIPTEHAAAARPIPARIVLGAVRRGDTAYVLHRESLQSPNFSEVLGALPPEVATLYRRGDSWRLEPMELMFARGSAVGVMCGVSPDSS